MTSFRKHPFIVYWLIAILTFGYSASKAECDPNLVRSPKGSFCKITSGSTSALFWPLFWTWEAFDAGRAALAQEASK